MNAAPRRLTLVAVSVVVAAATSTLVACVVANGDDGDSSYDGGRQYVLTRQPWSPSGLPATDAEVVCNCARYVAAGLHRLDGYPDGEAFTDGCRSAAADTPEG